jgi:hypothetical protein
MNSEPRGTFAAKTFDHFPTFRLYNSLVPEHSTAIGFIDLVKWNFQ